MQQDEIYSIFVKETESSEGISYLPFLGNTSFIYKALTVFKSLCGQLSYPQQNYLSADFQNKILYVFLNNT
jgi:hypothetical protein